MSVCLVTGDHEQVTVLASNKSLSRSIVHSQLQVILFTERDSTPGIFGALSVNLRKAGYDFADVHSSSKQILEEFGVHKVRCCTSTICD